MFVKDLKMALRCESCGADHVLTLLPRAKHTWKLKPASTYPEKMALVKHYKILKEYDRFPTWDQLHKGRAMKRAGQIYRFFAILKDPVGVSKECMTDINRRADKEGWNWNLETILKMAPDWLTKKQGGR